MKAVKEDIEVYKIPKETVRKYYKYVPISWTQPALTSNTGNPEMLLSGDNSAYILFDKNDGSIFNTGSTTDIYIDFDTEHTLQTMYAHANYGPGSYFACPGPIVLSYYDNELQDWVEIGSLSEASGNTWSDTIELSDNQSKRYKVHIEGYTYAGYTSCLATITFTGVQYQIEETTQDDYDFYKDIDTYYAINQ